MTTDKLLVTRVTELQDRARQIAAAPLLSRAGLAQEALSDTLDLLADMAARLDNTLDLLDIVARIDASEAPQ